MYLLLLLLLSAAAGLPLLVGGDGGRTSCRMLKTFSLCSLAFHQIDFSPCKVLECAAELLFSTLLLWQILQDDS
jgi:hypothetical protein